MEVDKTVFVGLSGGVDSSIAALRLKRKGYRVVGVFIKVWHPDFLVCNWEQERLDAMRVAAHLDIPFLTCDAEQVYKDAVAQNFISAYTKGLTPNPDVLCNQKVKFGAFLNFAHKRGADYIATGHYVQKKTEQGVHTLHRSVDSEKDQSYFLWTLTQEQLSQSLFPVGDTTKKEIRSEAQQAGVVTAHKKDSQGICFLGHIDIPNFLSHYTDLKPGEVHDTKGKCIGEHHGALVYTIGQRHGFTITSSDTKRTQYYIVSKDMIKNILIVDTKRPKSTSSDTLTLTNTNWIGSVPQKGKTYDIQIRYRQTPTKACVSTCTDSHTVLQYLSETDLPAPGQSCVLYDQDRCVGGGIIAP